MIDEPTEGLAPKIVEDMAHAIRALKTEGLSLVISEQNLHFARLIADRVVVIERGHVVFSGTVAELDDDGAVVRGAGGVLPEQLGRLGMADGQRAGRQDQLGEHRRVTNRLEASDLLVELDDPLQVVGDHADGSEIHDVILSMAVLWYESNATLR